MAMMTLGISAGIQAAERDTPADIPSAGYFPGTFPRDPVEVNLYLEHILLGQILEPLVETSKEGKVIPAVAAQWSISSDGKVITFSIRDHLKFANGNPVRAADAKYSLERHIQSANSQSKAYLSRIKKISAKSDRELVLELDSPYVAIFKALSRDQLGIVPEGWTFNPEKDEPFVGTGPYRAIRKNGAWQLVANEKYRAPEEVAIKAWKLILWSPKTEKLANLPLPDLIPFALPEVAHAVENRTVALPGAPAAHTKEMLNHFVQVSAWWYPHGKRFSNPNARQTVMRAMGDLLESRRKKLGYGVATGIVPQGVPGYLMTRPSLAGDLPARAAQPEMIRVAVLQNVYVDLNDATDLREIEKKWNVRFQMNVIEASELSQLPNQHPDVVVFGYAGGFLDPEGFLTVITASLKADLPTIFGDLHPLYAKASSDQNWTERRELYEELNRQLVLHQVVTPGWRPNIYSYTRRSLVHSGSSLSYTPKLKEFQVVSGRKEGKL